MKAGAAGSGVVNGTTGAAKAAPKAAAEPEVTLTESDVDAVLQDAGVLPTAAAPTN